MPYGNNIVERIYSENKKMMMKLKDMQARQRCKGSQDLMPTSILHPKSTSNDNSNMSQSNLPISFLSDLHSEYAKVEKKEMRQDIKKKQIKVWLEYKSSHI